MNNSPIPPKLNNWDKVQVYLKAIEGRKEFYGELSQIENLEHHFVNKTGQVVKVGHNLINTSEIAVLSK